MLSLIHISRVRKILASLKKAGLVSTKEGLDGGYQFSADASKVNLCMIADALGVAFVSSSWKSGNLEKNCLIASGMAGLLDGLYQQLDQKCREELKHITIADLEGQIFKDVYKRQILGTRASFFFFSSGSSERKHPSSFRQSKFSSCHMLIPAYPEPKSSIETR